MILNRIGRAFQDKNGSTLLIELVIVVLGIFIGLQVDDWNEERKLRAEDRLYMQRLHADVQAMIESNAEGLKDRQIDAAFTAVQSLQDCSLENEDKQFFDFALIAHQVIARLLLERATYDEMVAGGALARLKDLGLKQAITRLFAQAETEQQYIEYFASELGQAGGIIWNRVEFRLIPSTEDNCPPKWCTEPYVQAVSYDFETLCGDGEFRNAMVEVWDSAVDRRQVSVRMDEQLRALEGQLAEWLEIDSPRSH